MNPFNKLTGSYKINQPLVLFTILVTMICIGYSIAKAGILAMAFFFAFPLIILFLIKIFKRPEICFLAAMIANFTVLGLSRYITGIALGLFVDGLLILTFIALFFKTFYTKIDWSKANKDLTIASLIWYAYIFLELFNPEVVMRSLWFTSMRGLALYMVLTIVLVFLMFDKYKYLMYFLYLWCGFEILASIKSMIQLYIGLDPYEQFWLNTIGLKTHIIYGKLRLFSFFSDAGQFGNSQAHTAMVAVIIGLTTKKFKEKVFFLITAFFCFYGMVLSGTRGVFGVLAGSTIAFLALNRNIKALIIGLLVAFSVYFFFQHTYIGQGIYFINRMRSAFNPNDPSLLVRLENQDKLRPYLAARPFGGGLGHAGTKVLPYLPNTFLANIATDSWYVMIWGELGIVGLIIHLSILFYIIFKGAYLIVRIRNPELRFKMIALLCGIVGILISSYGNGVYGQMPTGLIMYTSMAFIFLSKRFDNELKEESLAKPSYCSNDQYLPRSYSSMPS